MKFNFIQMVTLISWAEQVNKMVAHINPC